jgi:glutamyl-tRNA reductase
MAGARLQQRARRVIVANRSPEKRERLAEKIGAEQLELAELTAGLRRADFVMTSTGAPQQVIDREMVAAAMQDRAGRPLVLLDLAVPRDIDPGCAQVPGVTVLDVDAIRAVTDTGRTGEEVAKARVLVDHEAQAFAGWTRTVSVEPTIAALRVRAEDVRAAELQRLGGRLGELDEKQREAVEMLTKGIVNTLLHEPSVRLKQLADKRGAEAHAEALRTLFDLPPEHG